MKTVKYVVEERKPYQGYEVSEDDLKMMQSKDCKEIREVDWGESIKRTEEVVG